MSLPDNQQSEKAAEVFNKAMLSAEKAHNTLKKAHATKNPVQTYQARQQMQIALNQLQHVERKYTSHLNTQQNNQLKVAQQMLHYYEYQGL